jgi:hypothetical protein
MTGARVQDTGTMRKDRKNENISVCILDVYLCVFMIKMVNFTCWHDNFIQENYNT